MLIKFQSNKIEFILKYLIILVVIIQVMFYMEAILNKLHLKNEYFYIDETTILESGKEVVNSTFENEYLKFNENISNVKYTSLDVYIKTGNYIDINHIPKFYILPYLEYGNISESSSPYNYLSATYNRFLSYDLYNNDSLNHFYNYNYEDYLKIDNNFNIKLSKNFNLLNDLYDDKNHNIKSNLEVFNSYPLFSSNDFSEFKNIVEFINKNFDEKLLQIMDRYYIHESSFVLSPLNELKLGKKAEDIFSQYGFYSIIGISEIMDLLGGFSLSNYEKSLKIIFLVYYLIFIFFIFYFFKDNKVRFSFLLILGISLYLNKYYFYQYPPGHAPFRHFFDILIVIIIYKFNNNENRTLLYSLPFVLLSILINKENGMFIWLAYLGMFFISDIVNLLKEQIYSYKIILRTVIIFVLGLITLLYYPLAQNPSSKYFLDGFYSFRIYEGFYFVLFMIIFSWFILIIFYNWLIKEKIFKLYLFTSIYAQLSYFYYVWGGGNAHLIVLIPIYLLPWIILFSRINFKYKTYLTYIIICILTVIYLFSLKSFIVEKYQSEKVFKNHKTYEWKFERAGGLISTVDPVYFEDSINLIKKYNKTDDITMISKYDNILSIFSKKYTNLQFFELRSLIVTKDEFNSVKQQIKNSNIIFVDNDIKRDFENELKNPNFWIFVLFEENIKQRIPKLQVLKNLFLEIENDYELVEKGKLISVYKRK